MSGHKYVTNRNNLFADDDDDVDDETFLKNSRPAKSQNSSMGGYGQYTNNTNPFIDDFEQQRQTFEQRRQEIEQRTLMSTGRSLGLLHDTEQVGIATAEELTRQREQLEKTSKQLDDINSTLRFSQKHLNGLKSVFGGLKNYLSGQKDYSPNMSSSPSGSKLSENVTPSPKMTAEERYNSHPVHRLRSDGFEPQQQQMSAPGSNFNAHLEQNLDDMVGSLTRLKGLALGLNTEIEYQNNLIDNITDKVEDADIVIGKQNKQMNKLLGTGKK